LTNKASSEKIILEAEDDMKLTNAQIADLCHHLRVATDKYDENIRTLSEDASETSLAQGKNRSGLIEIFKNQASQVRSLIEILQANETAKPVATIRAWVHAISYDHAEEAAEMGRLEERDEAIHAASSLGDPWIAYEVKCKIIVETIVVARPEDAPSAKKASDDRAARRAEADRQETDGDDSAKKLDIILDSCEGRR
jgi:hypothetical protein